jgi:hypothetical protein
MTRSAQQKQYCLDDSELADVWLVHFMRNMGRVFVAAL